MHKYLIVTVFAYDARLKMEEWNVITARALPSKAWQGLVSTVP